MNSIKKEIFNEIRAHHTPISSTQEEVKENKDVESQSLTRKVEAQLKKTKFEYLTYDLSSIQATHFSGVQLSTYKIFHSQDRHEQV